jgi:hypothetical protein
MKDREINSSLNLGIRILMTITAISFIYLNTFTNFAFLNTYTNECIFDRAFEQSSSLYEFLKENPNYRYMLVIISSLIIDYSVAILGILFIMYGKSWKPLFSFGFFFILRLSVNSFFMLRYPDQVLWDHPGLHSLTVSYFRSSDFFFSGHVGMNFISAVETYELGFEKLSYISFAGLFVQFILMIGVRGHYIIDLIAGLLAAHYFCLIANEFEHILQNVIDLDFERDYLKRKKANRIKLNEKLG